MALPLYGIASFLPHFKHSLLSFGRVVLFVFSISAFLPFLVWIFFLGPIYASFPFFLGKTSLAFSIHKLPRVTYSFCVLAHTYIILQMRYFVHYRTFANFYITCISSKHFYVERCTILSVSFKTRVAGWSRTKQSMELGLSLSSVDRLIKSCKLKYDNAQKYNPILPPRKNSAEETWMDEN